MKLIVFTVPKTLRRFEREFFSIIVINSEKKLTIGFVY
jgi:hypothetical protein